MQIIKDGLELTLCVHATPRTKSAQPNEALEKKDEEKAREGEGERENGEKKNDKREDKKRGKTRINA